MSVEGNVGLAFALTIGAGLATTIGALLPFFASSANKKLLAGALGLSAGVMIYVSMVEIFFKSKLAFQELPNSIHASAETAGCFFGGVLLAFVLDRLVRVLEHDDPSHDELPDEAPEKLTREHVHPLSVATEEEAIPINQGSQSYDATNVLLPKETRLDSSPDTEPAVSFWSSPIQWLKEDWQGYSRTEVQQTEERKQELGRLRRSGFVTALAVGIHNFPEGLATFIAALSDSRVGAALAVAVAIHNIPEGVCVSMPIYYSTGSRMKGFLMGTLSGLSEPFGALLGYLVLATVDIPAMYAIMFGIVAGMMVFISVKELLPTAHRYDPKDQYVSIFFVFGMIIIAVSLILFEY